MGKLVNLVNVWWFYTKKFFKSLIAYIGIFVLPVIFIFGLGSAFQVSTIFVEAMGFSLLFIEAITFGSTYFSMKKSTLTYNSELSDFKTYEINLAILLLMLIVSAFTLIYSISIFILIEHFTNILVDKYMWDPTSPLSHVEGLNVTEEVKIRWADVDFLAIVYYGFLYTLVMYSLSIFLTSFLETQKNFFIVILGFIFYTLIFGGIMASIFGASNAESIPIVPSDETPLVHSPWKDPFLKPTTYSWMTYVSFTNPLYWVNEWGFFIFGNAAYYNIQFNQDVLVSQDAISKNLTSDFNVYFKLHEGTAFIDRFLCSDLNSWGLVSSDIPYEQNIYQLSYLHNGADGGTPCFTLSIYDYTNESIPFKTINITNSTDEILRISDGYVFSIKYYQSLSPNWKYFRWSESWQYNAALVFPYIFILLFEFSSIIITWCKKAKNIVAEK